MLDAEHDYLSRKKVLELVDHLQWIRFSLFISATILLYDHLITFDMEVKLFWEKPWTFMKGVFVWVRYFGLFVVIIELASIVDNRKSNTVSSFLPRWERLTLTALLLTTEGVLLLWVYVVYERNIKVMVGMGLLFIAEIAAIFFILLNSLPPLSTEELRVTGIHYCSITGPLNSFNTFWIPVLAYHVVLLALFLVMGVRIYGRVGPTRRVTSKLLRMIYAASFVNFLAIFAAYLACVVVWLHFPSVQEVPVSFALSFSVTNCTRLLLNIRRVCHKYAESSSRPLAVEVEVTSHTPEDRY